MFFQFSILLHTIEGHVSTIQQTSAIQNLYKKQWSGSKFPSICTDWCNLITCWWRANAAALGQRGVRNILQSTIPPKTSTHNDWPSILVFFSIFTQKPLKKAKFTDIWGVGVIFPSKNSYYFWVITANLGWVSFFFYKTSYYFWVITGIWG